MLNKLSLALAVCAITTVTAGAADARRAPIEYAAGRSTSAPNDLSGGSARSYGYGATYASQDSDVIDLRRPVDEVTPASQPPANAPTAQGQGARPAWLESERVGPPYQANGRWYVPAAEPGYETTGVASWYGPNFHGGRTASGEIYDQEAITAAHPTLPIPSLVQVTNLENGREVIVRVNDRGPFVADRVMDLSRGAANVLGIERQGTARVHLRYLGPAPRHFDGQAPTQMASVPPSAAPVQSADAEEGPVSLLPPPQADEPPAAQAPQVQQVTYQPPAPLPMSGGYFVQVGAFSDVANAQRAQRAVNSAGQASVDVRRTPAGAELFRVRIGPFASRAEADAARRNAAALGYAESVVVAP